MIRVLNVRSMHTTITASRLKWVIVTAFHLPTDYDFIESKERENVMTAQEHLCS